MPCEQKRSTVLSIIDVILLLAEFCVYLVRVGYIITFSFFNIFFTLNAKSLKGKIVVITGAGGGLGQELSKILAKEGAILVLIDRNVQSNLKTAQKIKKVGGKCSYFICDITDRSSVYSLAEKITAEIGPVDILINNAGVVLGGNTILDLDDQDIEKTINTNTVSHFWLTKAFLPEMSKRNSGHIVTIASIVGKSAIGSLSAYCTSKFACVGFHESLQCDLRKLSLHGIKTTLVCPFMLDTSMFEGVAVRFNCLRPASSSRCAREIVRAIKLNKDELYFPGYLYYIMLVKMIIPTEAYQLIHDFVKSGFGMDTWKSKLQ